MRWSLQRLSQFSRYIPEEKEKYKSQLHVILKQYIWDITREKVYREIFLCFLLTPQLTLVLYFREKNLFNTKLIILQIIHLMNVYKLIIFNISNNEHLERGFSVYFHFQGCIIKEPVFYKIDYLDFFPTCFPCKVDHEKNCRECISPNSFLYCCLNCYFQLLWQLLWNFSGNN